MDGSGNAFVAGYSDSAYVPNFTSPLTMFSLESSHPSNIYAFVAKVLPDGSQLAYFSRFGGSSCTGTCFGATTRANALALDAAGNAWIAGETGSNRIPMIKALNATRSASVKDPFAAKLGPSGTTLVFSSLLGGQTVGNDSTASGIKVDSIGSAYVAGWTNQTDFPATPGAFQTAPQISGVVSAFVKKINETKDTTTSLAASPPSGAVGSATTLTATITGNAPTGTVTFRDGANVIGSASVSGSSAQLVTSSLAPGVRALTATYEGNASNNPSTSQVLSYSVTNPAAPPALTLSGVSDGQSITANGSGVYSGGRLDVNATAATGNTIVNVTIYIDASGFVSTPNQPSWLGAINIPDLGVGVHTIRGTATDNNGNVVTAAPIRFVVNAAGAVPPASIAITSPANGATLTTPGPFTLQASGSASVTLVRFYAGTTLVGSIAGPPFSVGWANATAGTYSLVAVASDSAGALKVSAAINVTVTGPPPPTVSLTAPTNGASYWLNEAIQVSATASAASGATIERVEFATSSNILATLTAPPYAFTWTGGGAGTHVLTARAFDSRGASATSNAAAVTINGAAAPTIVITSPAEGASFTSPASIAITVNAVAASGATITKVDFYNNTSTLLGTATTAPFTFTWNSPPAGSHFLTAVATDSRFQWTQSGQRAISVVAGPPTIAAARDWTARRSRLKPCSSLAPFKLRRIPESQSMASWRRS